MNYGNAVAGTARDVSNIAKAEQPRLSLAMDNIEKMLAECHGFAANIERAVDRISGQEPTTPEEKTQPTPLPGSLEGKLALLYSMTASLQMRLGNASRRLDIAV
jgi:hypothetical protein